MDPIRLSDSELDAILQAARPIAPRDRDGFLQAVASELSRCGEIGPGVVYRVVKDVQRRFFDPPDLAEAHRGRQSRDGRKRAPQARAEAANEG